MIWSTALSLVLALAAATQPSEEALTSAVADRMREAFPGRTVRIAGPLQLELLESAAGEPIRINLDRVWNVCRNGDEEACEETSARFVAAMTEASVEHPPVVSGQLRLMVRTRDYCDGVRRLFSEDNATPLTRDGPADLCTAIVADYPTTMRILRRDDLPALNLDADQAWALAGRQTLDTLPDPPALAFEDGFAIVAGQDYGPSIILDNSGWRALAQARGDLLMAVPEDQVVVVAREAEVDPSAFREAIRRAAVGAERPISSNIYRWTERGWETIPE